MNEQQYRDVLLVKAIETQPHASEALVPFTQWHNATEQALYESRPSTGPRSKKSIEQLILRRANHVLQGATSHLTELQTLRQTPALFGSAWLWWIPVLALFTGFFGDRIVQPHRLNLLSLPLLGFLAWNLAIYLLTGFAALWRWLQPASTNHVTTALESINTWWTRRFQSIKDPVVRDVANQLEQDWQAYSQIKFRRFLQTILHISAAALGVGVIASLWMTGLFTEYRIGWESTLLTSVQMQGLLNFLTWPAQQLMQLPAWSLESVERLQTWPAGNQEGGVQWIVSYTVLLIVVVVLPRLALAFWAFINAQRYTAYIHLPLHTPYFQKLAHDFASDNTSIVVYPFGMAVNDVRAQQVQSYARAIYGDAVHVSITTSIGYSVHTPSLAFNMNNTIEAPTISQRIMLFNLAATPEVENHGQALADFVKNGHQDVSVWIFGLEFAQRLGTGTAAEQRLQERQHLWQQFVQSHGLHAQFIQAKPTQ